MQFYSMYEEYIDDLPICGEFDESKDIPSYTGNVSLHGDILTLKHENGYPHVLIELYHAGIIDIHGLEDSKGEIYFKLKQELIPREGDMQEIAEIYIDLVNIGILAEYCKFIRNGKIFMQLPRLVTKFTDVEKVKIANIALRSYSDTIIKSIPKGIDYETLKKLIWRTKEEELIEMMEETDIN